MGLEHGRPVELVLPAITHSVSISMIHTVGGGVGAGGAGVGGWVGNGCGGGVGNGCGGGVEGVIGMT